MGYAFSKDALLAAFAMMGFPRNDLRADGIGLGASPISLKPGEHKALQGVATGIEESVKAEC